jgi:hypothetical protein
MPGQRFFLPVCFFSWDRGDVARRLPDAEGVTKGGRRVMHVCSRFVLV